MSKRLIIPCGLVEGNEKGNRHDNAEMTFRYFGVIFCVWAGFQQILERGSHIQYCEKVSRHCFLFDICLGKWEMGAFLK